jgi:hypothetical protein
MLEEYLPELPEARTPSLHNNLALCYWRLRDHGVCVCVCVCVCVVVNN